MTSRAGNAASRMQSVWTIREVLDWTTDYFRRGGIDTSRFEAELLLSFALNTNRLNLYIDPNRILTPLERERFRELVKRRHSGTPAAYLLGEVQFMNLTLKVNQSVLIPRPETEELVEQIQSDYRSITDSGKQLKCLDLGTGSGAIIIALMSEWPTATGIGADISIEALHVAGENRDSNDLSDRIELVQSDWFVNIEGQFDLIVSNPPYIPTSDLSSLSDEVIEHEPVAALDGGHLGTQEIEQIVNEAPKHLVSHGSLYMEIGYDQGERVAEIMKNSKYFDNAEILPDLAGRDRIVRAIRGDL